MSIATKEVISNVKPISRDQSKSNADVIRNLPAIFRLIVHVLISLNLPEGAG